MEFNFQELNYQHLHDKQYYQLSFYQDYTPSLNFHLYRDQQFKD